MDHFPALDTRYDEFAISSYRVFRHQKAAGVIPGHVKFQISLPSPASFVSGWVEPLFHMHVLRHYETAIARALRGIFTNIPAHELAIQLNMDTELSVLHGICPSPFGVGASAMTGLVERASRLLDTIPATSQVGIHLCSSDFVQRRPTNHPEISITARFAAALLANTDRDINWLHIPMPTHREDTAYFAPLRALLPRLVEDETQLYLGVIQMRESQTTQRRIRIASQALGAGSFGVATDCGMGEDAEDVVGLLRLAAAASEFEI